MTAEPQRMTPLELAVGSVRGVDDDAPPFPPVEPMPTIRAAFEKVVLGALQKPPCVVSFSGGRDSSAVLAVAAHVARREGLPLPVPVTLRFPDDPEAQEDDWQELVLRHIGLDERVTLSITDELDVTGPYAREVLRTYGLIWPANAHFHVPIAEQARGGTILTGLGGDETLTPYLPCQRVNLVLTRQVRPQPRDVLRFAAFQGPRFVQRAAVRYHLRNDLPLPWIRPNAQKEIRRKEVDDAVADTLRWDLSLKQWWRSRYRRMAESSLQQVAALRGSTVCNPFIAPLVLASMARVWGRVGVLNRADAMRSLFGDILPQSLPARTTKATFPRAFASPATASFARRWDGSGVDENLVDPAVLRRLWLGDGLAPDFRASPLFQAAWLATEGSSPTH